MNIGSANGTAFNFDQQSARFQLTGNRNLLDFDVFRKAANNRGF
jgi:hypothetical protein